LDDSPVAEAGAATLCWHLITGEYPPQRGGVSDYTRLMAQGLAAAGDAVHVWAPFCESPMPAERGIVVHRLPDHFGLRGLTALDAGLRRFPGRLLVQYVPHAFGWKAMNVAFCLWLCARRHVPIWIMFHEVAFPVHRGQPWRRNFLGRVNRWMAARLLRSAERVFISIPAWGPLLRSLGAPGVPTEWLPVPSNLASRPQPEAVAQLRQQWGKHSTQILGTFGTYSPGVTDLLAPVLRTLLSAETGRIAVLLGRGGEAFALSLEDQHPFLRGRLIAPGDLPEGELVNYLAACDLLIQPYPDGVSSRRTSVMAGLALGIPVVTTDGFLTEPLWRETGAVALAPAGSPSDLVDIVETLLASSVERALLAEQGQVCYDRNFAVEGLIRRLRDATERPPANPPARPPARDRPMLNLQRLVRWVPASWIRQFGNWRGRWPWFKSRTDWLPALLRRQEGTIQRGPGQGLRFNGGDSAVGFLLGTHDTEVQLALQRLVSPGGVVYDIGANVGFTAVLAARLVGAAGKVICFEPLSANARQIQHNASLNDFSHITVREVALGREDGEADFKVSASPTWGMLARAGAGPDAEIGSIRVPVRRLDSLVAEVGLPLPGLIKMDVEGAELDVLSGSELTLQKSGPVLLIELHGTNASVHELLTRLGYCVHVLGSRSGALQAPWDAQVIAVPSQRADLLAAIEPLLGGQP
jgi:FkbM family methyltransferase